MIDHYDHEHLTLSAGAGAVRIEILNFLPQVLGVSLRTDCLHTTVRLTWQQTEDLLRWLRKPKPTYSYMLRERERDVKLDLFPYQLGENIGVSIYAGAVAMYGDISGQDTPHLIAWLEQALARIPERNAS